MKIYIFIFLLINFFVYELEEHMVSKKHTFSSIVTAVFLIILIGGNYSNADIYASSLTYNANKTITDFSFISQWGYYLIINICNALNFSFIQYRLILYSIGIVVLSLASFKIIGSNIVLCLFYMVYPMIIDATQMKNFVAMSFVTLAIVLLSKGTKNARILFVFCIIVASSFHIIALIYLPLVIICDVKASRKHKVISTVPIVIFALLFSNREMSNRLSVFLLSGMSDEMLNRTDAYLSSSVHLGFLVYFLATFLIIFIIRYICKNSILLGIRNTVQANFLNIVEYCSLYSLLFMPFYFYRQDFSRLLRNFFVLFHIAVFIFLKKSDEADNINSSRNISGGVLLHLNKKQIFVLIIYISLLTYMFYWDIYSYKESVLNPFFEFNQFLN